MSWCWAGSSKHHWAEEPCPAAGTPSVSSAPPGLWLCLGLLVSSPNKLSHLMNFLTLTFPVSLHPQCQVAGGTSSSVCPALWVTLCPSSCTVTVLLNTSNTSIEPLFADSLNAQKNSQHEPTPGQHLGTYRGLTERRSHRAPASGAKYPMQDSKAVQQTQMLLQAQNWVHMHRGSEHNLCSHLHLC